MLSRCKNRFVLSALSVVVGMMTGGSLALSAVITSNPGLPPDQGVYTTPAYGVAYFGGGLQVVLSQPQMQPVANTVVRSPSGPNELENFISVVSGEISVNGSPNSPTNLTGPSLTEAFGKIGNVTGTFQTEMLQLNLSGNSAFGPYMIRESPTLHSTGQTSITDIGGGQYRIDSFFDVFTELSLDGGASWISSDGSTHLDLVPEPGTIVLLATGVLAVLAYAWRRQRYTS
jgi:hypothetical protein